MVLIGRGLLLSIKDGLLLDLGWVEYAAVEVTAISSSRDEGQVSAGLDKV